MENLTSNAVQYGSSERPITITVDSLPERGTRFTIDIPKDARPFQQAPTLAR
ncbi:MULTISPECIES: hypothetical protein [unclassified Myxococcus]|uniref:hypothetical protein n=1 Tax=unclassified Myxococcus TaxID=2648731 RepID=UPI001CBFE62E|nr:MULTISPECIES: hypothetical protein [unclassified Myxococcus]MBZ4398065.1 hypothetical protein [Myxococcus sp. AS-1-15]MBZ4409251.1 hypothetical protein [Myxococcus sp. XM-1-1-1]